MFNRPRDALKAVEQAITAAEQIFGDESFDWLAWPQQWSDTSCGFGGIAGQAFTTAQTLIASADGPRVLVFHAGRLAYDVLMPTDTFWQLCGERRLPGRAEFHKYAAALDAAPAVADLEGGR